MAPSSSTELLDSGGELLRIARRSLEHGVRTGRPRLPPIDCLPAELAAPAGAFVTLTRQGRLRGCIGTVQASDPLGHTVAAAACDAALEDPRFPAVCEAELGALRVEVSVLGPLCEIEANSHAELVALLRPGEDGVLLREGRHRATFLPVVWESLPEAELFLEQLWAKARLPARHWSPALRCYRYSARRFAETV